MKYRFHIAQQYAVNSDEAVRAVLGYDPVMEEISLNYIGSNWSCQKTGSGSFLREQCRFIYLCSKQCISSLWLKGQIWVKLQWYLSQTSGWAHSTSGQDGCVVLWHCPYTVDINCGFGMVMRYEPFALGQPLWEPSTGKENLARMSQPTRNSGTDLWQLGAVESTLIVRLKFCSNWCLEDVA